ncbi:MAG: MFS transporter [Microvirga sp.]
MPPHETAALSPVTAAGEVPAAPQDQLSSWLVLLMAVGAGTAVATLYYSQPMLGIIGADLQAGAHAVGWVVTLTQLGYAFGILLLAPLGDRYDRRLIILAKAVSLCVSLVLAGLAPSRDLLLAASFAIGLSATLAQDIVPAAAVLAPPAHRGRVVGTVMTGLLLGILLSRVVSGLVAEHFGWRAMFFAAAGSLGLLIVALWQGLPRFRPVTTLAYGALVGSLGTLWVRHGALRRAALAQGLLSVSFSAFWSTLAVMLHDAPFHLGAAAAGAFGLAGAVGALAAPVAGRLADARGPALVTRLGAGLVALSFALMLAMPWMPPQAGLWLIGASAVGFDLGVQASLIAHQTIIYGIDPAARSRLNAVLMVSVFIGMAVGSSLGSQLLGTSGWTGVTALATLAALAALGVRSWPREAAKPAAP